MPPIPQQSPRGGLIATVVVSTIIAMVCLILFFLASSRADKAEAALGDYQKKTRDFMSDALLTNPDLVNAKEAAKKYGVSTAVDALIRERNDLASTITANPATINAPSTSDVRAQASLVLKGARDRLKSANVQAAALPANLDMAGAINTLTQGLIQTDEQRKQQEALTATAKTEATAAIAAVNTQIEDLKKQLAAATTEQTKLQSELEKYRTEKEASVTGIKESADKQLKELQDAVQQGLANINSRDQQIKGLEKLVQDQRAKLQRYRMDPKENMVRVADGVITRVTGQQCYINLGEGDQITPGLTFEVYDAVKGIPALGDGMATPDSPAARSRAGSSRSDSSGYDESLPRGKGSIEVVSVGPGKTSLCQVIKLQPQQTIIRGDIIANLVYDPHVKFNFVVYGDFDMQGSMNAKPQDATVIRRLIEQWGGRVVPITHPDKPETDVTTDVDFVVMGLEPKVPSLAPGEEAEATMVARVERAKAERDAYARVQGKAVELGIPLLNQTRFLLYTGYFDQARR
jgi:regulator of replication initiation timing